MCVFVCCLFPRLADEAAPGDTPQLARADARRIVLASMYGEESLRLYRMALEAGWPNSGNDLVAAAAVWTKRWEEMEAANVSKCA